MHDSSRFSSLLSGAKTLLSITAGVKVTFIYSFTRSNVINRAKGHTWACILRNDSVLASLSVFMGVYDIDLYKHWIADGY